MLSANEIAAMQAVVIGSFDVTIAVQRKSVTPDGYGHSTEAWLPISTSKVNIFQPSATQLATYADVIGAQWAVMMRFAQTTDIKESDRILYDAHTWLVQNILNADSYSFSTECLMTVIV